LVGPGCREQNCERKDQGGNKPPSMNGSPGKPPLQAGHDIGVGIAWPSMTKDAQR
jgi:hypothetical protein